MNEELLKKGIDRRTIVKGAAWSAPIVAIAIAAPAAAASTTPPAAAWDAWFSDVTFVTPPDTTLPPSNGYPYSSPAYYPGTTLTATFQLGNHGPDPIPAGALFAVLIQVLPGYGNTTGAWSEPFTITGPAAYPFTYDDSYSSTSNQIHSVNAITFPAEIPAGVTIDLTLKTGPIGQPGYTGTTIPGGRPNGIQLITYGAYQTVMLGDTDGTNNVSPGVLQTGADSTATSSFIYVA
ncbi:hypothetical protein [Subtercola endophyticus]|uniref:hypothetical protein n=1 Tax=Subtercola endophyticus TaxID=2895559 RepID=UPI001E301B45|nr:hypothetical protein [Subtercola endophyticus]UFS60172.1 hypothetical protein LQ955_05280 [Subtercola endophyticus]